MPTDPSPAPPPTAPGISCPRCGTPLRPAAGQPSVACASCGTAFNVWLVEAAPATGLPPLRIDAPPDAPATRSAGTPADPSLALTFPVPPPPRVGTRAGLPKPVAAPDLHRHNFRSRWLESLLGSTLVVLVVVAVGAGGLVLWKMAQGGPADAPRETAEQPADTPADADVAEKAADPTPADEVEVGRQPLPLPQELVGEWESRVDDGSHSTLVFRPDGTMTIVPVQWGATPPRPTTLSWFLASHAGDEYVVEVGQGWGVPGNVQFTLRLTCPDGFTLIRAVRLSVQQAGGLLRYVRVGPPPP